jgi:2,4-dienoyl-CoA reductase (NADPH2)
MVDVPVSTVGRINDPYVAAEIHRNGDADLVGLARQLLCDPDFVKKTEEGRVDEIRQCTACCYCFDQLMFGIHGASDVRLSCALNAELGREGEKLLAKSKSPKDIIIVGAGPAGLEASRVAALRGHRVALFEKEEKIGGTINTAVLPPHKEELKNIIDYYKKQMELLPIDLHLGEECNVTTILEMNPDAIIIATGAKACIPDIPGIDKAHVASALDVLKGSVSTFEQLVIIGGGLIGLETAELLADLGHNVTVLEMLPTVGSDVGPSTRWGMISRLRKKVTIRPSCKVKEITDTGVIFENARGDREDVSAGTVIIAAGMESHRELIGSLVDRGISFYEAGSCTTPGQIAAAIADGFKIGCDL